MSRVTLWQACVWCYIVESMCLMLRNIKNVFEVTLDKACLMLHYVLHVFDVKWYQASLMLHYMRHFLMWEWKVCNLIYDFSKNYYFFVNNQSKQHKMQKMSRCIGMIEDYLCYNIFMCKWNVSMFFSVISYLHCQPRKTKRNAKSSIYTAIRNT